MNTVDIRSDKVEKISKIKFADHVYDNAVSLVEVRGEIYIEDAAESTTLVIASKADAENLIKALQKAIELNWWEN